MIGFDISLTDFENLYIKGYAANEIPLMHYVESKTSFTLYGFKLSCIHRVKVTFAWIVKKYCDSKNLPVNKENSERALQEFRETYLSKMIPVEKEFKT